MVLVEILAILALFFSLVGGFKEGAVKRGFSLVAMLTAIPLASTFYRLAATILSFLPGDNWENFVGFFVTLAFFSVILHIAFFLPRRIVQKLWKKGLLYRSVGSALNIIETSIGLAVFTLIIRAYPIIDWLERAVSGSGVLSWLAAHLGFVEAMLSNALSGTGISAFAGLVLNLFGQIFPAAP